MNQYWFPLLSKAFIMLFTILSFSFYLTIRPITPKTNFDSGSMQLKHFWNSCRTTQNPCKKLLFCTFTSHLRSPSSFFFAHCFLVEYAKQLKYKSGKSKVKSCWGQESSCKWGKPKLKIKKGKKSKIIKPLKKESFVA